MNHTHLDFLVIGGTLQARLVAGLLASVHGKTVAFQGESQSGYRLPRGLDLSAAPVTRPQTWALLQSAAPELLKIVSRIRRRGSYTRLDPIFFADGALHQEAIAHVRHMASAFNFGAERVPASLLGPGRDGMVLRDAVLLHAAALEPALDRWLETQRVQRLELGAEVSVHADGTAKVLTDGETFEVGQTVLADDASIIRHVPDDQWPPLLSVQPSTTILTQPTAPIAAPIMHQIDTGMTLHQFGERGISAMGPGDIDAFSVRFTDLLGRERPFRQAGQSSYPRLVTADGAAAVGRNGGGGPDLLAGFGFQGAFLAAPVARWLCGASSGAEADWFANRLVNREHAKVADLGGAW
jgi:hypothetical protein